MSLGEAVQLCVDGLKKDQLVDMLVEYLVPDQMGETTPQRMWRVLGELWQEGEGLQEQDEESADEHDPIVEFAPEPDAETEPRASQDVLL